MGNGPERLDVEVLSEVGGEHGIDLLAHVHDPNAVSLRPDEDRRNVTTAERERLLADSRSFTFASFESLAHFKHKHFAPHGEPGQAGLDV